MLKMCKTCKTEKHFSEFHLCVKNKDGIQRTCKVCEKQRKREWYIKNKKLVLLKQKEYYEENRGVIAEKGRSCRNKDYPVNLEKYMYRRAKQRAKNKKLEFNITIDDIYIPKYCPVLGLELSVSKQTGDKTKSPSLDRINSELGYVKGNIWVISNLANTMKSCATYEQLQNFAKWVLTFEHKYSTIHNLINSAKDA